MRTLAALRLALILALSLCVTVAHSHSGGLNSEGCHTNHKTGDYHCHRATAPVAANPPRSTAPSKVFYPNCAAARAAGAAPIRRGEPGYASHLDRDNDGIACE
jgi:hypothetical protein